MSFRLLKDQLYAGLDLNLIFWGNGHINLFLTVFFLPPRREASHEGNQYTRGLISSSYVYPIETIVHVVPSFLEKLELAFSEDLLPKTIFLLEVIPWCIHMALFIWVVGTVRYLHMFCFAGGCVACKLRWSSFLYKVPNFHLLRNCQLERSGNLIFEHVQSSTLKPNVFFVTQKIWH
jgi:hypothetical protein